MTTRLSAQLWTVPTANPINYGEGEILRTSSIFLGLETEPQAARHGDNSHVSKILPVTTLRTIDLGGKKISDPLFSRFCAEMRVFFEQNVAPKYVHVRAQLHLAGA